MRKAFSNSGFTLIELLIVVAIIAILAAIAVPNFLEAQTRSKVSRAKADLRTMNTALESYRVDHNSYPKCNNFGTALWDPGVGVAAPQGLVLERLSTPIAYITTGALMDPFMAKGRTGSINATDGSFTPTMDPGNELIRYYKYLTPGLAPGQPTGGGLQDVGNPTDVAKYYFILVSTGPDLIYPNLGNLLFGGTPAAICAHIYDPTNGTISTGSIYRVSGVSSGQGNYGDQFFQTVQTAQK